MQSWLPRDPDATVVANPRFDIRPRVGWYDGAIWHDDPGRSGEIFVFAWHPVTDRALADHGDPEQWEFYVVLEGELPPRQKTIGLATLKGQAAVPAAALRAAVAQKAAAALAARGSTGPPT